MKITVFNFIILLLFYSCISNKEVETTDFNREDVRKEEFQAEISHDISIDSLVMLVKQDEVRCPIYKDSVFTSEFNFSYLIPENIPCCGFSNFYIMYKNQRKNIKINVLSVDKQRVLSSYDLIYNTQSLIVYRHSYEYYEGVIENALLIFDKKKPSKGYYIHIGMEGNIEYIMQVNEYTRPLKALKLYNGQLEYATEFHYSDNYYLESKSSLLSHPNEKYSENYNYGSATVSNLYYIFNYSIEKNKMESLQKDLYGKCLLMYPKL